MRERAVRYVSTRGASPPIGFEDVLLAGPAPDGGLYVPEHWPVIESKEWPSLQRLGYAELAARLLGKFIGDALSSRDHSVLAERAYSSFTFANPAPLVPLGQGAYLLELFHGPTLAFKDYALQLLGQLFEHALARRGGRITILGATSGDTGSAAIAACAGRAGIEIYMLHPRGRVSEVQRRQMTTVEAGNVHNIAVEGTFDDCQDLVKAVFADADLHRILRLSAVNSINWARIAAQVVYYVWAGLKLGAPERTIAFAVPTGNFGNVYAGHAARRMGLPVAQLIIGSNRNDTLTRFFTRGEMEIRPVEPSLSPSMDIQVSSNFERLLFELLDGDGAAVAVSIATFRKTGRLPISSAALARARALFAAARFSDTETHDTIAAVYKETGVVLDPHSAVGVAAGRARRRNGAPLVALATAHPAKFPEAVKQAIGVLPSIPPALAEVMRKAERCAVLPNDACALKDHLLNSAGSRVGAEP